MIMAILPTVLPPITASFYFADTNFPDNCVEGKKNVPRSGLYGDRELLITSCKFANLLKKGISFRFALRYCGEVYFNALFHFHCWKKMHLLYFLYILYFLYLFVALH